MKNLFSRRRSRESGAAMLTAMVVVLATSSFIGAGAILALSDYSLASSQSRSEAALLMAEGGVNDELTFIATNTGTATPSSTPTVYTGTTQTYPGESHYVWGRSGAVNGATGNYWVCTTNNEWWKSGATPVAWDGTTSPMWITASSYVNKSWRRVEVQSSALSAFSQAGSIGLGNYNDGSNAVTVPSGAAVTVVGQATTNGPVSQSSHGSCGASKCLNANTSSCGSQQYTSSNCGSSTNLYTKTTPYSYPTCATCLKQTCGITSYSDTQAWNYISSTSHNSNSSGCYTYKSSATTPTLSSSNCTKATVSSGSLCDNSFSQCNPKPGTTGNCSVSNISCSSYSSKGKTYFNCTATCTTNHPFTSGQTVNFGGSLPSGCSGCSGSQTVTGCTGTTVSFTCSGSCTNGSHNCSSCSCTDNVNHVSSLIFEPGDYYFTGVQLDYINTNEIVIDSQALASGGTPGQVRFWVNDPQTYSWWNWNVGSSDYINMPVCGTASGVTTSISGIGTPTTTPDPSKFRIYYAGDYNTLTCARQASCTDYNGNSVSGDFNLYGGIYSVTKLNSDSSSLCGSNVVLQGSSDGYSCTLNGALLADHIQYGNTCKINFVASSNPKDPLTGAGVTGGYACDGQ